MTDIVEKEICLESKCGHTEMEVVVGGKVAGVHTLLELIEFREQVNFDVVVGTRCSTVDNKIGK